MLPGVVRALPGFGAGLARRRNAVGPPDEDPGIGVESVDMGAGTLVAATAGNDDLVVDQKSAPDRVQRVVFRSSNLTVLANSPVSRLVQITMQSPVTETTKFLSGKGRITYIGAWLDDGEMASAARWMTGVSGVTLALGPVPDGRRFIRATETARWCIS
jgi:hypothetical protein